MRTGKKREKHHYDKYKNKKYQSQSDFSVTLGSEGQRCYQIKEQSEENGGKAERGREKCTERAVTGRRSRQRREPGKEGDMQLRKAAGGQAHLGGPGMVYPKRGRQSEGCT